MQHAELSTVTRGLDRQSPPMILFEKAKRLGIWNPSDIDFSQDRQDWLALNAPQRDLLLRLSSMFIAGEEAVTIELLPLINVIASQGRIEEEMFLTTFLWEEAKHVDFFNRFLTEVCEAEGDLREYQSPNYQTIIHEALPRAMSALRDDHSPAALAHASSVYNMVVEGMLAETGYHAYFTIMDRHGILPGQRAGITKLKLDESRHIAYGVYLLSRLMAEDAAVWDIIEQTMNSLLLPGLGLIEDVFSRYDPVPFDVTQEEFTSYAAQQFQKRLERVRRAQGKTTEQLHAEARDFIAAEDE